jgi:hypothetical protein
MDVESARVIPTMYIAEVLFYLHAVRPVTIDMYSKALEINETEETITILPPSE